MTTTILWVQKFLITFQIELGFSSLHQNKAQLTTIISFDRLFI